MKNLHFRVLRDLQDTYVPFIAAASEKLEAVPEADSEASPDEAGATADSKTEEVVEEVVEEEGEKEETKDDGAKPTPESETTEPTAEGQETSTVEPMSQEENLGRLDEIVEGGAAEPMSQEEALSGLKGEPMSQSAPEHSEEVLAEEERQKKLSAAMAANVSAEDDVIGRKRSAEQTAGDDAQSKGDLGADMETDEPHEDGAPAEEQGQKKGEEGTTASGDTCDSSAPNDER